MKKQKQDVAKTKQKQQQQACNFFAETYLKPSIVEGFFMPVI
jgi:hypothetical protein